MVTLPLFGSWRIRELSESDRPGVLQFLARRPLHNVFLTSRIMDEGFATASPAVEVLRDGKTMVVASLGANVVIASDQNELDDELESALRVLAARVVDRYLPVRAIISEAHLVEPFWDELRLSVSAPTVVRLNQPILSLCPGREPSLPDLDRVRHARLDELDGLVHACAAMHLEEVGIDPMARDPWAYRQRTRELIVRRRSFVMLDSQGIAFKCELSAETKDAVQIMGVWTRPDVRRRGLARRGMAEVCGRLLRDGRCATLFVNDFNRPALALYESLGFRVIGTNRALIW